MILTSGSLSVTLPAADLGDSKQTEQKINFHRAMSGKLFSYKRTPAQAKYLWTVRAIPDADILLLRAFYAATHGLEVTIDGLDGYILNNPFEDIDNGTCKNDVTIEFLVG